MSSPTMMLIAFRHAVAAVVLSTVLNAARHSADGNRRSTSTRRPGRPLGRAEPNDSRMPVIRDRIANVPQGRWFTQRNTSTVAAEVNAFVSAAAAAGEDPDPRRLQHPQPRLRRGQRRRHARPRRLPGVDRPGGRRPGRPAGHHHPRARRAAHHDQLPERAPSRPRRGRPWRTPASGSSRARARPGSTSTSGTRPGCRRPRPPRGWSRADIANSADGISANVSNYRTTRPRSRTPRPSSRRPASRGCRPSSTPAATATVHWGASGATRPAGRSARRARPRPATRRSTRSCGSSCRARPTAASPAPASSCRSARTTWRLRPVRLRTHSRHRRQVRLSATVTSSSVTLSWVGSTDNVGVSGYDIFRAPGSSGARLPP